MELFQGQLEPLRLPVRRGHHGRHRRGDDHPREARIVHLGRPHIPHRAFVPPSALPERAEQDLYGTAPGTAEAGVHSPHPAPARHAVRHPRRQPVLDREALGDAQRPRQLPQLPVGLRHPLPRVHWRGLERAHARPVQRRGGLLSRGLLVHSSQPVHFRGGARLRDAGGQVPHRQPQHLRGAGAGVEHHAEHLLGSVHADCHHHGAQPHGRRHPGGLRGREAEPRVRGCDPLQEGVEAVRPRPDHVDTHH
mmetsp:Transcript_67709/g.192134  ORF Transcript_67709/g.192134 Transcript_67709/m.192134 type:complete len:250 (-) Transcript_67709:609-1358(-)